MKRRPMLRIAAAAAAIAVGAAIAPPAYAQTTAPTQAPAKFSEKEIKSFAVASLEIRNITGRYQPLLDAAKTESEKEMVRTEAVGKMTEAVRKNGLTVKKFNEISTAAQRDPNLATKIRKEMKEAQ